LRSAGNRSWRERFRKWRRRRPHGLALFGMLTAVVLAFTAVTGGLLAFLADRQEQARKALADGQRQLADPHYGEAAQAFRHGLALMEPLPGSHDLGQQLHESLARAEQAQAAARREQTTQNLHRLVEQIRFHDGGPLVPAAQTQALEAACRTVWEQRGL